MSDLDPTGPSQPTTSAAYQTSQNPASKNPTEAAQSSKPTNDEPVDQRIPTTQSSEGREWGLGRGIHGAPEGEEGKGLTEEDVGRHNELDGEQMAMPGEGKVADAVAGRGEFKGTGAGGEQPDLASDLDRKKAEQAEAREAMKQHRSENKHVGGAAGQQGGPATTIENKFQPPQ